MADQFSLTLELPYSGFTIKVVPLPPYYMDVVEEGYPVLEYPQRMLKLVAGDVVPTDYSPPESEPSPDDVEDYELYVRWHYVHKHNAKVNELRKKVREDLLYSLCVEIVSGPIDFQDSSWVEEIESALTIHGGRFTMESEAIRKIYFIKYVVIKHTIEMQMILNAAMYQEVDMQGVENALRGFRS